MLLASPRSARFALSLAVVYAIFGIVWVVASDTALALLVREPALLTVIQTWKGWLFVSLSAVLIYVVGTRLLQAIEDSERRYHLLFDDSPEALILYDPDTLRLVEANTAAGKLLGYDLPEFRTLAISDLIDHAALPALERELPRLRSGTPAGGTWQMRCKDSRIIDVTTQGQPVTIDGRSLRLVLLTDVTARLRAENQLLRTLDDLVSANQRVRELSHAISHDLQEPLRQVGSFLQLLERRYQGKLDADADQFIGYAVEGTRRLKALIGDVERFALSGPMAAEPVSLQDVVAEVTDDLRASIDAAGARITVGILPMVSGDAAKLSVILHALIDNALKFRHPERASVIDVAAEPHQGGFVVRVSDNGIGVDAEYRETIFSLFRRLHTRDRIPGNGTGLALARKLVEAHGGHIWVESVAEGGTVFAFTLPGAGQSAAAFAPRATG
jgi:PAS domain S-box-containing protein